MKANLFKSTIFVGYGKLIQLTGITPIDLGVISTHVLKYLLLTWLMADLPVQAGKVPNHVLMAVHLLVRSPAVFSYPVLQV